MKITFVFPGQGSQVIGMGHDFYKEFATARDVFHEIDDALNEKLSHLIFEGDIEKLTLTENTQPALMAVSMAMVRTIEKELGMSLSKKASFFAGHSLGEYTAYCASGAFTIADTAHLLRIRGRAMQEAVPFGEGGMAAILGPTIEDVESIAKEASQNEICVVANDNSPGQVVISGHKTAIDRAIQIATERGAKRAIPLAVSAPFHSPLMEPAAAVMKDALKSVTSHIPGAPIIANFSTTSVTDCKMAKALLVSQVTGRVRWRESMLTLKEQDVTHVIEIGAGKVLSGLMKRIDGDLISSSVNSTADMNSFMDLMKSL